MAAKLYTIGQLTVTTSGTEVQVSSSSIPVTSVVFTADPDNTGFIFVGDSNVSTTRAGLVLDAGQSGTISVDAQGKIADELLLSDLYVDADTNGDKVYVGYVARR